jgi:hypothetical protein
MRKGVYLIRGFKTLKSGASGPGRLAHFNDGPEKPEKDNPRPATIKIPATKVVKLNRKQLKMVK